MPAKLGTGLKSNKTRREGKTAPAPGSCSEGDEPHGDAEPQTARARKNGVSARPQAPPAARLQSSSGAKRIKKGPCLLNAVQCSRTGALAAKQATSPSLHPPCSVFKSALQKMVKIESPQHKTLRLLLVAGARSTSSPFILLRAATQAANGNGYHGPSFCPDSS